MCLVYNKLYGMRNVCLRYFNVYGVNQRYDAYGNVIPIFADRILRGVPHDHLRRRRADARLRERRATSPPRTSPRARAGDDVAGPFNIGSGTRITINELAAPHAARRAGARSACEYAPPRQGDVRDSLAAMAAAHAAFGFEPTVELEAGLAEYLAWIATDPVTARQLAEAPR